MGIPKVEKDDPGISAPFSCHLRERSHHLGSHVRPPLESPLALGVGGERGARGEGYGPADPAVYLGSHVLKDDCPVVGALPRVVLTFVERAEEPPRPGQ
eukprot:12475084-Alexandrium_andersonii.AAC.1